MKHFSMSRLLLAAAVLLLAKGSVTAQMGGGMGAGMGPGFNAAMAKLFGENNAFTAKTEVRILDQSEKEMMTMTADFYMLDNKFRMEMDMSAMKSAQMPAEAMAQMKQMGMDRIQVITRPDKKISYLIYPGLLAYAEMAMPKEEAQMADKEFKIQKTEQGKETIDGHPCVKNKVTMTDPDGKAIESLVWSATDMKDFPIQMQIKTPAQGQEATVVMKYKDVKLGKPDAKLFDPPAGYARHENIMSLMQVGMQKGMGGQGPK